MELDKKETVGRKAQGMDREKGIEEVQSKAHS